MDMRITKLISTARNIEECINSIKANKTMSYEWFACKGVNDCLFEIGGKNEDELELKLYIPTYDKEGEPIALPNGFVDSNFAIVIGGLEFSSYNVYSKEDIDIIKLAKTVDFRKFKPEYRLYERVVQTAIMGTLINL
jgi:hypothetical protein